MPHSLHNMDSNHESVPSKLSGTDGLTFEDVKDCTVHDLYEVWSA